jgi:hypothetical protein
MYVNMLFCFDALLRRADMDAESGAKVRKKAV